MCYNVLSFIYTLPEYTEFNITGKKDLPTGLLYMEAHSYQEKHETNDQKVSYVFYITKMYEVRLWPCKSQIMVLIKSLTYVVDFDQPTQNVCYGIRQYSKSIWWDLLR